MRVMAQQRDLRPVLEDLGLDPALADAATGTDLDEGLAANVAEARRRCGDDVGTPILSFSPPDGPALFGPVIDSVPFGEDALRLWEATYTLATWPGCDRRGRSRLLQPDRAPAGPGDHRGVPVRARDPPGAAADRALRRVLGAAQPHRARPDRAAVRRAGRLDGPGRRRVGAGVRLVRAAGRAAAGLAHGQPVPVRRPRRRRPRRAAPGGAAAAPGPAAVPDRVERPDAAQAPGGRREPVRGPARPAPARHGRRQPAGHLRRRGAGQRPDRRRRAAPRAGAGELRDPRTRHWRGKLASDRFHPNDRGYAAITEVFGEALRRAGY
ncbi:hypothetical protein L7F22_008608 [Adiantum nelumboides]|nr:hypothetical protein [Adiantum nelumboides]